MNELRRLAKRSTRKIALLVEAKMKKGIKCRYYNYYGILKDGRMYRIVYDVRVCKGKVKAIFPFTVEIEGKDYKACNKFMMFAGFSYYLDRPILKASKKEQIQVEKIAATKIHKRGEMLQNLNDIFAIVPEIKTKGYYSCEMDPYEFKCALKNDEKVEFFAKNGILWIYINHKFNRKGKTPYSILGIPGPFMKLLDERDNDSLLCNYFGSSYSLLKLLASKGFTAEEASRFINSSLYDKDYMNIITNFSKQKAMHFMDFVIAHPDYKDYYSLALLARKDLTSNYWLMPKDYEAKHNELGMLYRTSRKADNYSNDEKLNYLKIVDKINFKLQQGGLKVEMASSIDQIVDNGTILNICVGFKIHGYIERMLLGQNWILFGYIDNNLACCIEYNKETAEIVQIRGHNNCLPNRCEDFKNLIGGAFNGINNKQLACTA